MSLPWGHTEQHDIYEWPPCGWVLERTRPGGWGGAFFFRFPLFITLLGQSIKFRKVGVVRVGLVTEVGVEVPGLQSSSLRLLEPRFAVCKKG